MTLDAKLLGKLKRRIRLGRYSITRHGLLELEADALFEEDIVSAVETSEGVKKQSERGRRSAKYLVTGQARDGTFAVKNGVGFAEGHGKFANGVGQNSVSIEEYVPG